MSKTYRIIKVVKDTSTFYNLQKKHGKRWATLCNDPGLTNIMRFESVEDAEDGIKVDSLPWYRSIIKRGVYA